MTELRIATTATQDLRDIRAYSKAAFGARTARSYLEGLRERFALLRDRPGVGRPEPDLGAGCRSLGYRSHRIYYQADMRTTLILRILHHAQDRPPALTASL